MKHWIFTANMVWLYLLKSIIFPIKANFKIWIVYDKAFRAEKWSITSDMALQYISLVIFWIRFNGHTRHYTFGVLHISVFN